MKTPVKVYTEPAFLVSNLIMGLGVAMLAAADLGMSMTGAPAYLLSLRFPALSFGTWELFIQLLLILLTFAVIGTVKMKLFLSLLSGSVYAVFLDLWRAVIPALNPAVTAAGDFHPAVRVALFLSGVALVMFSVAVFFRCYVYPQSYDLFVRELCKKYRISKSKAKTGFDCSFLLLGITLSLLFFSRLQGIGIGTVAMSLCGGSILGLFDRWLSKVSFFQPLFLKAVKLFEA